MLFVKRLHFTIATAFCLGCSANLHANEPPQWTSSAPARRVLIVETVHPFEVRQFLPLVEISAGQVDPSALPKGSVEATISRYFDAIRAGDYKRYLAQWTKESQTLMTEEDRNRGRSPKYWQDLWKEGLAKTPIFLTHRIAYGKYVLIAFRIGNSEDAVESVNTLVLTQVDSIWMLTQELRGDQFVTAWNTPGGRVKIPAEVTLRARQRSQ